MENTKNKGPIIASLINLVIGLLILTSIGMIIWGSYSLYENFKGITKILDEKSPVMPNFIAILQDPKHLDTLGLKPENIPQIKNGGEPDMKAIFGLIEKITPGSIDQIITGGTIKGPDKIDSLNTIKELKKIISNLTAATASDIMEKAKAGGIKAITWTQWQALSKGIFNLFKNEAKPLFIGLLLFVSAWPLAFTTSLVLKFVRKHNGLKGGWGSIIWSLLYPLLGFIIHPILSFTYPFRKKTITK